MSFLALAVSFAPWIVLKVVTGLPFFDPVTMLKTALVMAAVIAIWQARQGVHKGVMLWGTFTFFAFTFVTIVLMSNMWVIQHLGVLANGKLTLMTLGSMLLKRPFTMDYAKQHVDPKFWDSPEFIRRNYLITGAWAVAFLINLLNSFASLYGLQSNELIHELIDNGVMVLAMLFTSHYSKKKRTDNTSSTQNINP